MSTDVSERGRGPCPCGAGEIVVYLETPDHGWASGQWQRWWGEIRCATCDKEFVVRTKGGVSLVRRGDAEAHQRKMTEWSQQCDLLMESVAVKNLFEKLVDRLKSEHSIAAVWRRLSTYGLTNYTESTFRRHWRGAEDWVREYQSISLLERMLSAMKDPDPALVTEAQRLADLKTETDAPLPAIPTGIKVSQS